MFCSRPVEGDAKAKSSDPADAAALIAEALKRKFAHRYRHDSERDDTEEFKLPLPDVKPKKETPLVRDVTEVITVIVKHALSLILRGFINQVTYLLTCLLTSKNVAKNLHWF